MPSELTNNTGAARSDISVLVPESVPAQNMLVNSMTAITLHYNAVT